MKLEATVKNNPVEVEISQKDGTFRSGSLSGEFAFLKQNGRYLLRTGTRLYKLDNVNVNGSEVEFSLNGRWHTVSVKDEQDLLLDKLGFKTSHNSSEGKLNAPMPGKILDILIAEGDRVQAGQPLVILEAMKMENELKSPVDGVVTTIAVETGQSLEKNTFILEIEDLG